MRPTIVTNILLVKMLSLANFALIYIMTAGGSDNSTDILPVYSYQQGFVFKKLGYGALLGDVLVMICNGVRVSLRARRAAAAGPYPAGRWGLGHEQSWNSRRRPKSGDDQVLLRGGWCC